MCSETLHNENHEVTKRIKIHKNFLDRKCYTCVILRIIVGYVSEKEF